LITSNQGSRGSLEFKAGLENAVYFEMLKTLELFFKNEKKAVKSFKFSLTASHTSHGSGLKVDSNG